ncbi:Tuberous sclerosis 2-like protein [Orbilia oligospora]|uniref:Tuberous sclerosis 2-like protein n=1 Tax=Orbilia oligospora TaxID=2813651 RepID=A0A7C8K1Y7_ORBOL|nr:Tuberous sclerosis 2-like protein [Orbilia oligospora]KAF3184402.1 Tuberous sclerosis 2-like protein [Orbilia oligospora]KAF3238426.1 Tuberous sclerosis 2-like protein [Orbilia oligospora]KAF3241549.1 Tuberous sclerosis 2-like protein [Orbilia oligospora]KAF3276980.1 Tuberous sclerosis 2-like protein [Orbilia oligospora]
MSQVDSSMDGKSSGLARVFGFTRVKSSAVSSPTTVAASSSQSPSQNSPGFPFQTSGSPRPELQYATNGDHANGIDAARSAAAGGSIHTHHLLLQLKHGNPLTMRVNAAETLCRTIVDYPISSVSTVWLTAQDLADIHNPPEARHVAFRLLIACISQSEGSSLDRITYFRAIANNHSTNDFELQLEALVSLTNAGKDLVAFERDIQPLLSRWLKAWFREAAAARQARKRDNYPATTFSLAESNLQQLFSFLINVVKFSFKTFQEKELVPLLNDILTICKKTTSKEDITRSLMFIDALITYGYIPKASLTPCIEVLCGAYATIRDLTDATWNAICNLCKSYMAHNSILALKAILESPSRREGQFNSNTLRGAVCFFERLLLGAGDNGLPELQISTVMGAYKTSLSANNPRLELDLCRATYNILVKKDVTDQISFDEWSIPLDIVYQCTARAAERAQIVAPTPDAAQKKDNITMAVYNSIAQIIGQLEKLCTSVDFTSSEVVMDFFLKMHGHLPDSGAELVINYYATEHLCYPSCSAWLLNSRRLIDIFFKNRDRPYMIRVSILSLIKDVYETIKEVCDEHSLHTLIVAVFDAMPGERDERVLEKLVRVAVDVAKDGGVLLFEKIMGVMVESLENNSLQSQHQQHQTVDGEHGRKADHISPSNIIVRGLTWIFIQNFQANPTRALAVYDELLRIAESKNYELDARLTAVRLLVRIRADSENYIHLVEDTESYSLATLLGKTEKMVNDLPKSDTESISSEGPAAGTLGRNSSLRNINSQGTLPRTASRQNIEKYARVKQKPPMWVYPEVNPFPETLPQVASHELVCRTESTHDASGARIATAPERKILNLRKWLDIVNRVIESGTSFEFYSYLIVHIPSQLSNKTLFSECGDQIQHMRLIICEQLHTNRLPNLDLPSDVKKADLAVALINLLTVLISYQEYFSRTDQEAIVKAFQLGLHSWQRTAKPCIHALSICIYELPTATTKFLPGILVKLSQIITTAAVSVHILEFLSLLAHLPSTTVNFTEPDYKSVFAIAFRYIQHTKETHLNRSTSLHKGKDNSNHHPPEANHHTQEQPQISQYVLTLAYNVISTWFLALKLNDRAKYVTWITRGLILGDGGHRDVLDEQSQASIDMLRRFTYADVEVKNQVKAVQTAGHTTSAKSWLLGSKIITINTSVITGISQVVIRQPSGSSSFNLSPESQQAQSILQGTFTPEALNVNNGTGQESPIDRAHHPVFEATRQPSVLPSHMLMQLTTDVSSEISRPVLLPEDDQTQRAINVFDRIPVVDFHKIGVVYVGSGQTEESEILSNVMGSSDYTEFVGNLGDLIALKGTTINTGGLDREVNMDGEFAFYWSDKITQIIFHVTTMMPTDRIHDPRCTNKKRHIGNDFVNIIFNNSGLPWRFNTIPSQFNFVSIVITPEAKTGFLATRLRDWDEADKGYYKVQLMGKQGLPEISPASATAEGGGKMVSGKNLSAFVRNLALNASVFSHVYNEGGLDFVSNWRHRLRAINKLREKLGVTVSPGSRASDYRRISLAGSVASSTELMQAERAEANEVDGLLENVDFSKWT